MIDERRSKTPRQPIRRPWNIRSSVIWWNVGEVDSDGDGFEVRIDSHIPAQMIPKQLQPKNFLFSLVWIFNSTFFIIK
jgi:hypothetical protein